MARFTRVQFLRQIDPLAAFKEAEQRECCDHHDHNSPHACTFAQDTLQRAWQGFVMMELLAGKRRRDQNHRRGVRQELHPLRRDARDGGTSLGCATTSSPAA
jgi:hypothetical protein